MNTRVVELKENVIYESFDTRNDMMEVILNMIYQSKTDKILYKGTPLMINYKTMKKVLLKDYTKRIDPEKVRFMYDEIIKTTNNREFCLIYKNK